jgi:hypothetical protein
MIGFAGRVKRRRRGSKLRRPLNFTLLPPLPVKVVAAGLIVVA